MNWLLRVIYFLLIMPLNYKRIVIHDNTSDLDKSVGRRIYNVYKHDQNIERYDKRQELGCIIWNKDNPYASCFNYVDMGFLLRVRIQGAWAINYGFKNVKLTFQGKGMRLEASGRIDAGLSEELKQAENEENH